jgi:hypothetical protein
VTLRGRMVALTSILAIVMAVGIVVLVRSRTPDCSTAAPRPALPQALRALGDFDQAYDGANTALLLDAARRAATVLHTNLIGSTPEPPVPVAAGSAGVADALVVPLRAHPASSGAPAPLSGVVVFLRDCQGNAYFSSVEDDAAAQPAVTDFPAVSREQAVSSLGAPDVRLTYQDNPLAPRWVSASSPSRSLAAR